MKKYDYLIHFMFSKEGYLTPCSGTVEISRDRKIKSFEDTRAITKFLQERTEGATNLSIVNIMYLGCNKH